MMRLLVAFVCLAFAAAPAPAEQALAPLPAGLASSGEAAIAGLYAESEAFGQIDVNETLDALETACIERGSKAVVAGRDLLWSGKRQIYRTHDSIAIFDTHPEIVTDKEACTARISLKRETKVATGPWAKIRTGDWIGEHPRCVLRFRCQSKVIAGIAAQCVDRGDGLVGTGICFSEGSGLSNGLIVSRWSYSDDGSSPNSEWSLAVVLIDTLIDPVVFRDPS